MFHVLAVVDDAPSAAGAVIIWVSSGGPSHASPVQEAASPGTHANTARVVEIGQTIVNARRDTNDSIVIGECT